MDVLAGRERANGDERGPLERPDVAQVESPAVAPAPWDALDACRRSLKQVCAPYLSRCTAAPPAAIEWLLDHYTYLRTEIRQTREMLPRAYYRALSRAGDGGRDPGERQQAVPRIRLLARIFIERAGDEIDAQQVTAHFEEAQAEQPLTLAELWAIAPMVKLTLFEKLADRIALLDGDPAAAEAGVRTIVTRMRSLDELPWHELTESLSRVHEVLLGDPAGVYASMNFDTRDIYRRAAERVARRSPLSEVDVARLAVALAGAADDPRHQHVGHYLVGRGQRELEARAHYRNAARLPLGVAVDRWPALFHLAPAAVVTALIVFALARWLNGAPWWYFALLAIPASDVGLAVANKASHLLAGPRRLPRLDFSDGIPDDCRTLVVIPALLFSRQTIDTLLERIEIHYLANRDPNLLFGLLTDCADSAERDGRDEELGRACADGVRALNVRYAAEGARFYLFHRAREWNAREGVWMGYERKRGKLDALNAWLLRRRFTQSAFLITAGDLEALTTTRYVITLDADTQLPLNSARTLVATAAHPLNAPVFDERDVVCEGYAILQPRVSVSAESASRSRLARMRSGTTGLDPYATAVSDVYQDLYGRASFTGKGLYDVAAFHRALYRRFPENALLSHDLIEGEHARVGLVSDVEFIDDYPGSCEVYSKRKHRWTRGDWQLLYWLLPRVPDGAGRWVRNPLSLLSRWKILDNLRRSLVEPLLAAAVVAAWLALPGRPAATTAVIAALLVAPAWADLAFACVRLPPWRFLPGFVREKTIQLCRAHADGLVSLGLMLHQAMVMTDAIARTLVRRLITRRRLLEWETSAQAESSSRAGRRTSLPVAYLAATPLAAAALLVAVPRWSVHPAGLCVALLWAASPLIVAWLDRGDRPAFEWKAADLAFVRGLALRTWRYFDDWSTAAGHWLVPDNVQETPPRIAHRASPTNIGLQLAATVAARDFGYQTLGEMTTGCARVMATLDQLERCRGHFYNWYDTHTLEPLNPKYVSTVDSGNLCASLVTVRQACLEARWQPVLDRDAAAGLRDHAVRVRNALPRRLRRRSVARALTSLLRRLDEEPRDAFAWARLLGALRPVAIAVDEWLRVAESPADLGDAREWASRLVRRVDAAWRELCRYAPWVDTPAGEFPADLLEALGRMPRPAACQAHYDAIAERLRAHLVSGTADAPLWRRSRGLMRQVAAARAHARRADADLLDVAARCAGLVSATDFAFLFDTRRKLLHIGYTPEPAALDRSYYDLLASEARSAVLLAIAKGDIPAQAWFHLGRKLAPFRHHRVLLSWGGTMFEHLMPSLFMRTYEDSLLGASIDATVRIQRAYAREQGVPWGFSEAAHADRDGDERYQYRTFGVPQVAMKRMAEDDLVVAPYASALALMAAPAAALENLRRMTSRAWIGPWGLYESVDYAGRSRHGRRKATIVRAFMAHHQAMSLLAFGNVVTGGRMQRRFHAEPMVAGAERLLQERLPTRLPVGVMEMRRQATAPRVLKIAGPRRGRLPRMTRMAAVQRVLGRRARPRLRLRASSKSA